MWYFNQRIIPDKSQVEIVLGRTVPGNEADSSGLSRDQTSVLSRRRKTGESILETIFKLYWREDVICQNPEDIDPDGLLDEGELTELQEVTREEVEVGVREQAEDQKRPELYPEPEVITEREGVHERIHLTAIEYLNWCFSI